MGTERAFRQRLVRGFVERAFGEAAFESIEERASRVLEEALELAQACGVGQVRAMEIAAYVYGRPAGTISQEIGGVGVTLLALAERRGLSADGCEQEELERVLSKSPSHFRERQERKAASGIAMAPPISQSDAGEMTDAVRFFDEIREGDRVFHRRADMFGRVESLGDGSALVRYEWPCDPGAEPSDIPLGELRLASTAE